jgi:hypothetical protein
MSLRSRAPSMLPTRLGTAGRLGGSARRLSSGLPVREVEKRLRLPEYLLNVPPTQVSIVSA